MGAIKEMLVENEEMKETLARIKEVLRTSGKSFPYMFETVEGLRGRLVEAMRECP